MLITYNLMEEKRDKVQTAIDRLRMFEPPEGYHIAFSGGKDSQAIYHLCKRAGVKFEAHYRITSVDPPELVRFIKSHYPDVHLDFPRDGDGNVITMWNLIPREKIPPTRIARYCCRKLKEDGGKGEVCVTGVRWSESVNRAKNQGLLRIDSKKAGRLADELDIDGGSIKKGSFVLNYDNADARRIVEQCYRTSKTLLNPIIDWEKEDVWCYLNDIEQVEHCSLYDEGFKRLGCIGCPMNPVNAKAELERYPTYKRAYIHAFDKMLIEREKAGLHTEWQNGEEVMKWWLGNKTKRSDDGQINVDMLMGG